jgi:ubiquinone/menaquinone biosynthesis C-methylase UbiE
MTIMDADTSYFDDLAKDWDLDPVKLERAEAVARQMRERIPLDRPMSALEYGCGTGMLSFALLPVLSHITLADSSPEMLRVLAGKISARRVQTMTTMRLDLTVDPLPQARYDIVYSLMTLHHVPEPGTVLRRFFALLNPSGWLCIADLDKEDGSFHGPECEVHRGFDRGEFRSELERAGFSEISFSTPYVLTKETSEGPREFPLFLAMARKTQQL